MHQISLAGGNRRSHEPQCKAPAVLCIIVLLLAQAVRSSWAERDVPEPAAAETATAKPGAKPESVAALRSSKRGLIDIPSTASYTTQDLKTLTSSPSDLTWFYSYSAAPLNEYIPPNLQFIPMLSGLPGDGFRAFIQSQLDLGKPIQHIFSFNEPDLCYGGGSCIDPDLGASIWKTQLEPLKKRHKHIQLGLPAVTGSPQGLFWLQNFFAACNGGCNPDFMAIHWYGDFAGLAGWIGQMHATFGHNVTGGIWVTEFAYPFVSLEETQKFYNQSTRYMDGLEQVKKYAYFGTFRSSDSNVGPNAAMLSDGGRLTDIGAWYKGSSATGNLPGDDTGSGENSFVIRLWLVTFISLILALALCMN